MPGRGHGLKTRRYTDYRVERWACGGIFYDIVTAGNASAPRRANEYRYQESHLGRSLATTRYGVDAVRVSRIDRLLAGMDLLERLLRLGSCDHDLLSET